MSARGPASTLGLLHEGAAPSARGELLRWLASALAWGGRVDLLLVDCALEDVPLSREDEALVAALREAGESSGAQLVDHASHEQVVHALNEAEVVYRAGPASRDGPVLVLGTQAPSAAVLRSCTQLLVPKTKDGPGRRWGRLPRPESKPRGL